MTPDQTTIRMPPIERTIVPPPDGWEEHAFYAVDVSVAPSNPIWGAIFYAGFLNGSDNGPGGYSTIWSPTSDFRRYPDYDGRLPLEEAHYLRVLHKLNVPHGHM
jgi:hypothetical protein